MIACSHQTKVCVVFTLGGSSNASLLMGMMPSPAGPASSTTPVVSAPSAPANSNIDLLQGLLGPSHPSTPAPSSTPVIPSPGASADLGGPSLSGLTLTPTCAPLQPMSTMPSKLRWRCLYAYFIDWGILLIEIFNKRLEDQGFHTDSIETNIPS